MNPLLDTLLSRPLSRGGAVRKVSPSPKEAALLRRHARDAFGFFADTVSADTHFLPPDNLQLSPFRDLALRTSPTNIGMYLTSVLAAYDLGFIDGKEPYIHVTLTEENTGLTYTFNVRAVGTVNDVNLDYSEIIF